MHPMAVAIINWNTRELLRGCLQSVASELPVETVVVDNGSSDGSVEMVRAEFPEVTVVCRPDNPGYGAASNEAFRHCRARQVLLLNSDTIVPVRTLERLSAALERRPRAAIVGPKLLNADGTLQPSCFPFPGPFVPLLKRQPLAAVASAVPALEAHFPVRFAHDRERRVPWVVGAVLAIRREAFEAVGGFDERFHMYYEEVDLAYRLERAGWESWFTPEASVTHLGGASTTQRRAAMLLRLSLSAMDFYRRHRRGPALALALGVERAGLVARLARDAALHRLTSPGQTRDRLAEDIAVWRSALTRGTQST